MAENETRQEQTERQGESRIELLSCSIPVYAAMAGRKIHCFIPIGISTEDEQPNEGRIWTQNYIRDKARELGCCVVVEFKQYPHDSSSNQYHYRGIGLKIKTDEEINAGDRR
jgi:hypothetical protein